MILKEFTVIFDDMKKLVLSFFTILSIVLISCVNYDLSNKTECSPLDFDLYNKESCEYLLMIYADGDNSLYANIFEDVNEAEYGIRYVESNYGYYSKKIKVVVLWDGLRGTQYSGTYLFELGSDNEVNMEISSSTKNLSSEAKNWISTTGELTNNSGEVAMSSYYTLAYFLNWCEQKYDAQKKILILEDHGTGPGNFYSRSIVTDNRAICQDLSVGSYDTLYTKDVSKALEIAGYGNNSRLDLLIEDVCYGTGIEDIYELNSFTQYYIGSANQTPGEGHNYTEIIKALVDNDDIKSAGKQIVSNFADYYRGSNALKENNMAYEFSENPQNDVATPTIALFCAEELPTLAQKITTVADLLISEGDEKTYLSNISYNEYLRNNYVKNNASSGNVLYYTGTMNYLFDIGWMMDRFSCISSEDGASALTGLAWKELNEASNAVNDVLSNVIVCSWRDGYSSQDSSTYGMYSIIDGIKTEDFTNHIFGMTICGGSRLSRTGLKNTVYSWYKTDLAFGRDTSWYELLVKWFSTIE